MHETTAKRGMGPPRRVLILVENLPSPFDRRVWQEACALRDAGYVVSIICPTGKGCEKKFEAVDGIAIWRYDLPVEGKGALGYAIEYSAALFWAFLLSWRVLLVRGFDIVHACNPPDLFFLIGGFFKLFGKKFVFDHHDINPELYEAKFGRRDFLHRLLLNSNTGLFAPLMYRSPPTSPTGASRSGAAGCPPSACSSCAAVRVSSA